MKRIRCARCGAVSKIQSVEAGRKWRCRKCGDVIPQYAANAQALQNSVCSYCGSSIGDAEISVVCPDCRYEYHEDCRLEGGGCQTVGRPQKDAGANAPPSVAAPEPVSETQTAIPPTVVDAPEPISNVYERRPSLFSAFFGKRNRARNGDARTSRRFFGAIARLLFGGFLGLAVSSLLWTQLQDAALVVLDWARETYLNRPNFLTSWYLFVHLAFALLGATTSYFLLSFKKLPPAETAPTRRERPPRTPLSQKLQYRYNRATSALLNFAQNNFLLVAVGVLFLFFLFFVLAIALLLLC